MLCACVMHDSEHTVLQEIPALQTPNQTQHLMLCTAETLTSHEQISGCR